MAGPFCFESVVYERIERIYKAERQKVRVVSVAVVVVERGSAAFVSSEIRDTPVLKRVRGEEGQRTLMMKYYTDPFPNSLIITNKSTPSNSNLITTLDVKT